MAEGKVRIFTGNGRGKTPAALGEALILASGGKSIIVVHFLKRRDKLVDNEFTKRLEPEIKLFCFGKSDVPLKDLQGEEREDEMFEIRSGLDFARKVMVTGACDVLVLDEVLTLIKDGIITVDELKDLIQNRGEEDIILTGREMNDEICVLADEISDIQNVRFMNYDAQTG